MRAKKENKILALDSRKWLFTVSKGWNDWFTSFENAPKPWKAFPSNWSRKANEMIFKWKDYQKALPEVFSYQPYLLELAEKVKKEMGLETGEYAAIFIRRGCKIKFESEYFDTKLYVDRIFKEWPECKKIFVQTDDYRAYLEVRGLVPEDVAVFTTCPEDKLGAFVFEYDPLKDHRIDKPENHEYLEKFKSLPPQKTLPEMSKEELFKHVAEMLVGLHICKESKGVALEYFSNVSRFIALAHKDGLKGIWNIDDRLKFDENTLVRCPRYYPFLF
jgi:hypothetical protein